VNSKPMWIAVCMQVIGKLRRNGVQVKLLIVMCVVDSDVMYCGFIS